jgi:uncharacterized protein (TIGR03437 family)
MRLTIRAAAFLAGVVWLPAPALLRAQTYTISTIAGNGVAGFSGDAGAAGLAQLNSPSGMALDKSGNIYVADSGNQRIREILTNGTINTVAGNGTAGYAGDGAAATSASLFRPSAVAVDGSGNLYIADAGNNVIRKITGSNISTIAGVYALGPGYNGDGATAINSQLNNPLGVAVDTAGNIYIADFGNNRIRKIGTDGKISTFAGTGIAGVLGDSGAATRATLNGPRAVAVDAAGNLYIADSNNQRVRVVTASNGVITTVAGTGTAGFLGDLGPANKAQLNQPRGVGADNAGNVYIADYSNSRIRKVSLNGAIATIAGNGRIAYSGDGGPATSASLQFPLAALTDTSGKVYIADTQNNVVRQLTPDASTAKPAVSPGGILNPLEFGGSTTLAPGSWVEIYGTDLASIARDWTGAFDGINAPTLLGGTNVSIGGVPAALSYVSPGQVNAQVPSTVATGAQNVVVTSTAGAGAPVSVTVQATQPGLFAPPQFNIGGKQYAGAVFADGTTYVLPAGAIAGITSHPAKAGDTITLYGIGFGPVTPAIPSGQIVQQTNTLTTPFQAFFGQTAATVSYDGLAGSAVGLYQFNVVVPGGVSGDVPFTFMLGGVQGTQTLFVPVQ